MGSARPSNPRTRSGGRATSSAEADIRSYALPGPGPPVFGLTIGFGGSASGSKLIYGGLLVDSRRRRRRLPPTCDSQVEIRYRYNDGQGCNFGFGTIAKPGFNVTATILKNCLLVTQNVDFGSTGVLGRNVDATSQIVATCSPGTKRAAFDRDRPLPCKDVFPTCLPAVPSRLNCGMDIKGLVFEILAWLQVQLAELAQLWSLYQLAIILALFTFARLAASRVELGSMRICGAWLNEVCRPR
ncbi:spore coat protein U domain-containing protein [Mesorhizobium sp. INR15]|uniref:spore coat protein U domain-containing protein n=1 Tax=Mesorhizobium sp. INR15 TaxID=2654248 RepID=UPI0018C10C21|nr:hypothetical protein GA829_34545 [Mesorhizobium sp. INR15]